MAEDHEVGIYMGITMHRVQEIQFRAMRGEDQFNYKSGMVRNRFEKEISRLRELFNVKPSI